MGVIKPKGDSTVKKRLSALMLLFAVLLSSCSTANTETGGETSTAVNEETHAPETDAQTEEVMELTYFVRSPYNDEDTQKGDTFTDLEKAKSIADDNARFGCVVFDNEGNIVYNPNPSLAASKILHHAKLDADYMRDKGYKYGDASENPALNKREKVVSCDRFVGWVLYDAGFNKNRQPSTKGYTLYTTNNLEDLLKDLGFEKITDKNDVEAGDIVFVGTSYHLAVPEAWKSYPKHVFICAGREGRRGDHYRYDAGSDARIQSTQPSLEPLSTSGAEFAFAYRPTDN